MTEPAIISRNEWGSQKVVGKGIVKTDLPIFTIFVSLYSGLPECDTKESCFKVMKDAQEKAIKDNIDDIPYSFVIGKDGEIFEGRGWDNKPQKAIQMEGEDFCPNAYDISFFGDFSAKGKELPAAQFKSLINLLAIGVKKKYVLEEYDLEAIREEKFVPKFRPGKDKMKNVRPIKVKGVQQTKPYKGGGKSRGGGNTTRKAKFNFKGFNI